MKFIKSRLTDKTKVFLANELKDITNNNLKEKIELFDKYLCISKDQTSYDGLNDKVSRALNELSDGGSAKELLPYLSITEQYLRSLVNLFNIKEYKEIIGQGQEFKEIIIFLGMTKVDSNKNLKFNLTYRDKQEGLTLKDKFKSDLNQYHWANAYFFRNESAHTSKSYGYIESLESLYSILYVLLESTWKYKAQIESLYTEESIFTGINKKGYFKEIIDDFEQNNLQKTFVVMTIVDEDYRGMLSNNSKDDQDDEVKTNLLSSLDIMEDTENKKLYRKLIGEAGLGKSRLMKYLQYKDAKEGKTYPVYIELRELFGVNLSLLELIASKAGLSIEACTLLMQEGGLSLYLDGINEILCPDNDKKSFCGQIGDLAAKYPKTKILVSDRENSYITVKGMPTYLLVKLDQPLVHDFIAKNSKSKELEEKIIKILEEENYLYKIIKTPFMVEVLMELVDNNEYDPSMKTKNKIEAKFVESLIKREAEEKFEGRASKIKLLLTHLLIKGGDLIGQTDYFKEKEILFRFSKCMEFYRFEADTVEMLELIVQMGLLVKAQNNDHYSFSNEMYESYFREQAIDTILELED